jgi:hypothetical protein
MFVKDREGHVAEQRRQDRTLRSAGGGFPKHTILTKDPGLQERLHQGQDTFVSDADPHSI